MNLRDLVMNKIKSGKYIRNKDGSVSTERGISFENEGKHYVTPSIVDGVQREPRDAMRMADLSKTPSFGSQGEADQYSQRRSRLLGTILRRLAERKQI